MNKIVSMALVLFILAGCSKEDSDGREPPVVGSVDLGLSVDWAECNLGAENAWDYGNYYAWGETTPKSGYTWNSYVFWISGSLSDVKVRKYVTANAYGNIDGLAQLDSDDDVARKSLGKGWRMPTDVELAELRDNCDWTLTTLNGVRGYQVKSRKSDASIFLPAAGDMIGNTLDHEGRECRYWSSKVHFTMCTNAMALVSENHLGNVIPITGLARYVGCPVRPVYDYR